MKRIHKHITHRHGNTHTHAHARTHTHTHTQSLSTSLSRSFSLDLSRPLSTSLDLSVSQVRGRSKLTVLAIHALAVLTASLLLVPSREDVATFLYAVHEQLRVQTMCGHKSEPISRVVWTYAVHSAATLDGAMHTQALLWTDCRFGLNVSNRNRTGTHTWARM